MFREADCNRGAHGALEIEQEAWSEGEELRSEKKSGNKQHLTLNLKIACSSLRGWGRGQKVPPEK